MESILNTVPLRNEEKIAKFMGSESKGVQVILCSLFKFSSYRKLVKRSRAYLL